MAFAAVFVSLCPSKPVKIKGALLAIVVSAFTFWKTIIYVWYAHPFLTEAALTISVDSFKFFHLPTSFWLICPLLTIYSVGGRLAKDILAVKEKKA